MSGPDQDMPQPLLISAMADSALLEMASAAGITSSEFLELLLNYAYSIHRRPGSWEANQPFDVATYVRPDSVADRWF